MEFFMRNKKDFTYRWAIPNTIDKKELLKFCYSNFGTIGVRYSFDTSKIDFQSLILCTNEQEILTFLKLAWDES